MRDMELRQLRSFVVLAEELHFRRAAERLHIAQPSLSQQLRTLEDDLGVRLLERDRRRVDLTAAGAALLVEARDLLARADRAAATARAAAAGERGRLRLSLTRSMPGGLADDVVEAFRAEHPEVDLELSAGYSALHVEQLRDGSLDAAFVRPPLHEGDLEELELAREPLVCVLPSGHRLARRRTLRVAELRDEPLVWWPEDHGAGPWHEVMRAVYGDGPVPPLARAEPEEARIVSAVAHGAGVSLIGVERSKILRVPGTVYRRFAPPVPTMGIALAWRRDTRLPALDRLRDVAVRVARDWPATPSPPPRPAARSARSSSARG